MIQARDAIRARHYSLRTEQAYLDPLVTAHDCWLLPGECDQTASAAYQALFSENLTPTDIDSIRHSVRTGLPIGNLRFRREIEAALSIRMGHGKRRRPGKSRE